METKETTKATKDRAAAEGTTRDLKNRARRVKREMDELETAAHGMTFEELIRLLAPGAAQARAESQDQKDK